MATRHAFAVGFVLRVIFADGTAEEMPDNDTNLEDACSRALRLADTLGLNLHDGKTGAKSVAIYENDRVIISIAVVNGGLRNC